MMRLLAWIFRRLDRRPSPIADRVKPLNPALLSLHFTQAEDRARFGNPHQSV